MREYLIHISITIPVEADTILDVEVPEELYKFVAKCRKKYKAIGSVDVEISEG